jgi:hypothetical protein
MAKSKRREETAQAAGDIVGGNPDPDRVAQRAYELYQERGGGDGRDMDDWFSAERELARRRESRSNGGES